jgi:hypothetical protein
VDANLFRFEVGFKVFLFLPDISRYVKRKDLLRFRNACVVPPSSIVKSNVLVVCTLAATLSLAVFMEGNTARMSHARYHPIL